MNVTFILKMYSFIILSIHLHASLDKEINNFIHTQSISIKYVIKTKKSIFELNKY